MKWCLMHEILSCIYAHSVLEVGLRGLDKSFNLSYLYIENFVFNKPRLKFFTVIRLKVVCTRKGGRSTVYGAAG